MITLRHYPTGEICTGPYCERCMLDWLLLGGTSWVIDDEQTTQPARLDDDRGARLSAPASPDTSAGPAA